CSAPRITSMWRLHSGRKHMATHRVITSDAQIGRALRRAKRFVDTRATSASYDATRDRIVIGLSNGPELAIPRKHLQGLENATPAEIRSVRLNQNGTGLSWPDLDVDHYVFGLVTQNFGTKQW